MNATPPAISPRLRSREPLAAASHTPPAAVPGNPLLRVLIRLPNIAAPSTAAARFQFANKLFSTLKRRYAAAAFAVFVVCMIAMLLRGKHGTAVHNDLGSDAPPWNGAVTVSPVAEGPGQRMVESAESQSRIGKSPPWSPAPQNPSDAQPPARNVSGWQPPTGGIGSTYTNSSAADDQIPVMNRSFDALDRRAPTSRQSQPTAPGAAYMAQRYVPAANTFDRGIANPVPRAEAQLMGTIGSLPDQSNGDFNGSRNSR
ncbi:MAG TPA: hypothetical protein VGY55_12620 [Pirellulales bacterium]|jgi:hypothetical protein|nr:hypothetical protein [Pirellulales bacterium]